MVLLVLVLVLSIAMVCMRRGGRGGVCEEQVSGVAGGGKVERAHVLAFSVGAECEHARHHLDMHNTQTQEKVHNEVQQEVYKKIEGG